jgi:hypothetical protein
MSEKPSWFDARLSIGNLITIGVVLVGLVSSWYRFDNRVALMEDRLVQRDLALDELKGRVTVMERERGDLTGRVIRIEEKISAQSDTLARILRSVESRNWQPDGR